MTKNNIHRLLKRQLEKFDISEEERLRFKDLFAVINDAYKSADEDLAHLENVLEVNSQELYKANSLLKQDNLEKTRESLDLKKKLDNVMDNVNDIIFELDVNGVFTYLNSAWVKYSGESAEESLGKNYMEFSNGIAYFDPETQKQISDRNFLDFKTVFSRYGDDGNLYWWDMSVKLIRKTDDSIEGAIGSLVDVTSLKKTEAQLREASEVKGQFLSTMSHEIRTPLNAVVAISNILLMDSPKDSQLENLKALKFSSKHLLTLINDILDYNKMVSGNLTFDESTFRIGDLVDGIINSYAYSARERGVNLDYKLADSIPDSLLGDSTRLSQVLTNLIGNAIKFTEEGSVTLSVACVSENEESVRLSFEVLDTGIGIAQDKLELIFEQFTQAERNTTNKYGGTGLGLAIIKKIVNLQGSIINVESEVGKGSRFWFELDFDRTNESSLLEIDIESDTQFDLSGLKLLVVDDNRMNLMVVQQFLNTWNVEFEEAVNGKEAYDKVLSTDYDVVLMDLRMPVMDGYAAVEAIRNEGGKYQDLPIIALSASVSNDVLEKVSSAGMDGYLCKPFDPIDLYRKLNNYLPQVTKKLLV